MQNVKNTLQQFVALLQKQVTLQQFQAHMQACNNAAIAVEDALYAQQVCDLAAWEAVDAYHSSQYSIAVQKAQAAIAVL
jgi:hypothetical protein